MSWLRFWRREEWDKERARELAEHLELETQENIARGMAPEEARFAARRKFGNVTLIREEIRRMNTLGFLETFWQDLRYAARMLAKNPGFTIVAVLTLALGIGANTAIFSVVNAVLLNPLPYSDPDRLVLVKEVLPNVGPQPVTVSAPDIAVMQSLNRVFEGVAGFRGWGMDLFAGNEAERVFANRVSSNLFPLLGVNPIVGRAFTPQEDRPGQNVVILSYGLWQRRFGRNPQIAGQTLALDRKSYTIVGVMPKGFLFPLPGMSAGGPADLWVPLALTPEELVNVGDNFDFGVLARLNPGFGLTQANADMELVARGILATYPKDAGDLQLGVVAQPMTAQVTGPVRPMLLLLLGAVAFVLLIACSNVANLLLVRAADRQREIAVRLALGAGRFRLLRQLLVEGMLLSFAGGAFGLFVSYWIKDALVAAMPGNVPQFHPIELDPAVLVFTLALAVTTGMVFGLLPALSAMRTDPNQSLKEGGRGSTESREHQRLRAALIAVEVALSVVLLTGAGLLIRSFQRVLDTKPGFEPEHVLTAQLNLPESQYTQPAQIFSFYRQLLEHLQQTPGVKAAGTSTDLPLQGGWTHLFTPEGYQLLPGARLNLCNHSVIFGEYLQAMGIPLLQGRYFNEQDRPDATHALIISASLAKRYWPNQNPIGKRLKWGPAASKDPWLTVVGVVGDVKQGPLEVATIPHTYEPYLQLGAIQDLSVAVRVEGDPAAGATSLRAAVWGLDRQLAVARVRTMDEVIVRSTAARRFNLVVLGSFAALALLLAVIGIYGVLAYSVTRRTQEIGVRMALGAQDHDVMRLVLTEGARVAGIGMAAGAASALLLSRFLQEMLYEVRPGDPATFAAVLLLIGAVALAACYFPAWRATKIEPVVALRYE